MRVLRVLMLLLLSFNLGFAQITLDSAKCKYMGNAVYKFFGYGNSVDSIKKRDYRFGFFLGKDKNNLTYVPAERVRVRGNTITWHTTITNPPYNSRYFFAPYVMPKGVISKIKTDDNYYSAKSKWKQDIFQEPTIESDLPRRIFVRKADSVTVSVFATGQNLKYQWYKRTVNIDSTLHYIYDSLGVVIDSVYRKKYTWNNGTKIAGATSKDLTFVAKKRWNRRKIYCGVYNTLGEAYTRETIVRVR